MFRRLLRRPSRPVVRVIHVLPKAHNPESRLSSGAEDITEASLCSRFFRRGRCKVVPTVSHDTSLPPILKHSLKRCEAVTDLSPVDPLKWVELDEPPDETLEEEEKQGDKISEVLTTEERYNPSLRKSRTLMDLSSLSGASSCKIEDLLEQKETIDSKEEEEEEEDTRFRTGTRLSWSDDDSIHVIPRRAQPVPQQHPIDTKKREPKEPDVIDCICCFLAPIKRLIDERRERKHRKK